MAGQAAPEGIDLHLPGEEIPETMRSYPTRGTPEMAIIDRYGIVRFQRFGGFDPVIGEGLINSLLTDSIVDFREY